MRTPENRELNERKPASWGLVADDLTGANDAGAAFAEAGLGVEVVMWPHPGWVKEADLKVLNTRSRHDSAPTSSRKVGEAVGRLRKEGRSLLYKKMDSTLKGNLSHELKAALEASGKKQALVCPAFPAQGRVVRKGEVWVHKEHLGRLRERFALFEGGIEAIHQAPNGRLLEEARNRGGSDLLLLADAWEEEHLEELARWVWEHPEVLAAGSTGLARALARTAAGTWQKNLIPTTEGAGPMLVFLGSENVRTLGQLEVLRGSCCCRVWECGDALKPMVKDWAEAEAVVVRLPVHQRPDAISLERLDAVRSFVEAGGWQALVLSGGDTAQLVLEWLGCSSIQLAGELLQGIPWGTMTNGLAAGRVLVTKAGGFGDGAAFVRIRERLGGGQSDPGGHIPLPG